ncbi:MAG: spondin domain-containing protein [Planctomycetota bacterium]
MPRLLIAVLAFTLPALPCRAIEAEYEIAFENLWNPAEHPLNYPGTAHFTALVGASHSDAISFWSPGVLASRGVELVAELGNSGGLFRGEVSPAIRNGLARDAINTGEDIFLGETSTGTTFTVTSEFPLVTLLSMVAPSPDWFVGIHDVDLREGGTFAEEKVFEFNSFYDAGTEEGTAFSLSNPDTVPPQPIRAVAGAEAARQFISPAANAATPIPPITRITLTRVSLSVPEPTTSGILLVGLFAAAVQRPKRHAK